MTYVFSLSLKTGSSTDSLMSIYKRHGNINGCLFLLFLTSMSYIDLIYNVCLRITDDFGDGGNSDEQF